MKPYELGKKGELLASKYLEANGYKILKKNYRCPLGEIDLIAKVEGKLIFIEVKTRRSLNYGFPQESITYTKINKIRKVAHFYLKEHNLNEIECRFDVVSLILKGRDYEIEVIKDAF